MKLRPDIVRTYLDVHSWVGIVSGLALFVAFYAGAITMFEEPLQRWASPPSALAPPPSLERTPELVAKVQAAHPEAARRYQINLDIGPERPGRVSWSPDGEPDDEHGFVPMAYASLAPDGTLQVETQGPSPVAQFIDTLHQQVGLPFDHEIAMPIAGAVAILYLLALVSGVVVLLPTLVRSLFAVRVGGTVRRMWLDVHNVLGLFSLPFHVVMALTSVVFAFHGEFYAAQGYVFPRLAQAPAAGPAPSAGAPLPPAEIVRRLQAQAPGFTPVVLEYGVRPGGAVVLRVGGTDPRYGLRGPTQGFALVDAADGRITETDYMPGFQDGWSAAITSFFALHFGNFGGAPIRWAYFLLGLSGAGLFYTGNLLWIESRRRRDRKTGLVDQTRATRVLAALTVGVPLGCVAGISATLAAAKIAGAAATITMHALVYHAVFAACVAWSCARGAARAGGELLLAAAAATLLIPLASLGAGARWYADGRLVAVDLTAMALAAVLAYAGLRARRRSVSAPHDSVWAHGQAA